MSRTSPTQAQARRRRRRRSLRRSSRKHRLSRPSDTESPSSEPTPTSTLLSEDAVVDGGIYEQWRVDKASGRHVLDSEHVQIWLPEGMLREEFDDIYRQSSAVIESGVYSMTCGTEDYLTYITEDYNQMKFGDWERRFEIVGDSTRGSSRTTPTSFGTGCNLRNPHPRRVLTDPGAYRSVYFVERPFAFATGYLARVTSSFSRTIASGSSPRSLARKRQ